MELFQAHGLERVREPYLKHLEGPLWEIRLKGRGGIVCTVNARLKDEFGGRSVRVRGHAKVMCHLMFGILALAADQILRLIR